MRVFKGKQFAHWAKDERIQDDTLCKAAQEIIDGKVEAALGKYLYKKRVPKQGMGKSGGYRVIVAYKKPDSERIFFIDAFSKNEKGNLSSKEEAALSKVADAYISASEIIISQLKKKGAIFEICGGEQP
mgnify:CR=1 FL=1